MTNPYAPPTARVDDVVTPATEAAPRLWNPNAAVNWSLLFSPAFGAWLHIKNWEALGEPQKAKAAKTWIVISLVLLVSSYVSAGRVQAPPVKQRFGKGYPRRGWSQPLLSAVGAVIVFFALVFVIAFAAGMAGAR